MTPAPDPVIRAVMRRVVERYIEPARIDPTLMLAAATAALETGWPGLAPATPPLETGGGRELPELLAATLRRAGRATIVGERTFGKIVVQQFTQHDEVDLTVKLSVAYLRARGERLPATGLVPDRQLSEFDVT